MILLSGPREDLLPQPLLVWGLHLMMLMTYMVEAALQLPSQETTQTRIGMSFNVLKCQSFQQNPSERESQLCLCHKGQSLVTGKRSRAPGLPATPGDTPSLIKCLDKAAVLRRTRTSKGASPGDAGEDGSPTSHSSVSALCCISSVCSYYSMLIHINNR